MKIYPNGDNGNQSRAGDKATTENDNSNDDDAERDHAALKAWLSRHRGRTNLVVEEDVELTGEQKEQIRRAIDRDEEIYSYVSRLATWTWEQHYKSKTPDWKLLPDTLGVLTQLDNMLAGIKPIDREAVLQAADEYAYRCSAHDQLAGSLAREHEKQLAPLATRIDEARARLVALLG